MKPLLVVILTSLMLFATAALAQSGDDASVLRREHWGIGVMGGGGNGLVDRTNVHFLRLGARVGRVMTGELGENFARGSFELDSEITPVDYVLWGAHRRVYSLGVTPLIMKWNFTQGKKTIPYVLAQGGFLWSNRNVPPGNTSKINFVSGVGVGVNHFVKPGRSVSCDVRATHLSNASLGTHNPGVNASVQFSVGYNWWKH